MSPMFKTRRMEAGVVLRAAAISLVALNHANPDIDQVLGFNFSGGMSVLMALSGYFFAKFVLDAPSLPQMRHRLIGFGRSILLPSFFMVLFFFIILRKFDVLELLFIRNLFTDGRISKFPTWYPQVMMQILIVVYILSYIGLIRNFGRKLLPYSVVLLFVASVLLRFYLDNYSDGLDHPTLPYSRFWNFCLGWCFYFFADLSRTPKGNRVAMAALAIASSFLVYGAAKLPAYCLIAGTLIFLFVRDIAVPAILHKLITIVAMANLHIFLWHRFFFEIYEDIMHVTAQGGFGMWLFGMSASVVLWIGWEAAVRTAREFALASTSLKSKVIPSVRSHTLPAS